jgi:hypothetical protein
MPRTLRPSRGLPHCSCEKCVGTDWNSVSFLGDCAGCQKTLSAELFVCPSCDLCRDCCNCWLCPRCEVLRNGAGWRCQTCLSCMRCCDCLQCGNCERRILRDSFDESPFPVICLRCSWCVDCGCRCAELRAQEMERQRLALLSERDRRRERTKKDMQKYRERVQAPLKFHRDENGRINRFRLYNADGLIFHRARGSEHARNPSHRYISEEFEIADIDISSLEPEYSNHPVQSPKFRGEVHDKWHASVVSDISLPEPRGLEINTTPASGDLFCQQIEDICETLNKYKATCINLVDRAKWIRPCGLHVHVDARDYSYLDLRKFIFVYEKLEPSLFQMLPGYRRASHFAAACGSVYANALRNYKPFIPVNRRPGAKVKGSDIARHAIIQAAYGSREPDRHDKRSCPLSTRYRSLNLHAFFYRGTLEFRHMYGTVDAKEAVPWGVLMALIVDYAFRLPEKRLKTFQELTALEALHEVAQTPEVWEFCQKQMERFNVPQQVRESPRLGEVAASQRWLYASGDVLLPMSELAKREVPPTLPGEPEPQEDRPRRRRNPFATIPDVARWRYTATAVDPATFVAGDED